MFNITVDGDKSDGKLEILVLLMLDDGKTDREEDMNLCCTFGTAASQKIETVKRKIPGYERIVEQETEQKGKGFCEQHEYYE